MNRTIIVALLLLAFGSGLGSGFVVGRSRAVHDAGQIPTRKQVLDGMADDVGLTAEQYQKISEIQDKYHPEYVKANAAVTSQLTTIRTNLRNEIRGVLDSEAQRHKFDEWCRARDERRAANEK
jgi:hypothetical protein